MITKQQRKALLFIEVEMERSGVAPSLSEIAGHLRYRSRTQAIRLLEGLEERGFIRRCTTGVALSKLVASLTGRSGGQTSRDERSIPEIIDARHV